MDELVALNLLEYADETARLSWHDLLREFVETRCIASPNAAFLRTASLRHARHYTGIAKEAKELYKRGHENVLRGLALFDRERAHLEAAFATLVQPIPPTEMQHALVDLVDAAVPYTGELRFHPRQRITWLQAEAARAIGRKDAEGAALGNLGNAYNSLGEYRQAIEFHEQHLQIAREIGDRRGEGMALGNLGSTLAKLGEIQKAIDFWLQSLPIRKAISDLYGEGIDCYNLSLVYETLGDLETALSYAEWSLAIWQQIESPDVQDGQQQVDELRQKLAGSA